MSIPHQTPPPGAPAPGDPGPGGYPPPQGYGYPPAQGYGYPTPGGYGAGGYPPPGYGPAPTNGLAIAALVLGIVGLLGGIIPLLGWFASPFALAAVGFAIAGLSRAKTIGKGKGLAIGGLVTGVLAIVAIVAWTAWFVWATEETADIWSGEAYLSCDVTRDVYEDAVEEFRSVEGREPASEDELIEQGHLGWASGDFEVRIVDGRAEVVTEAGSSC
jgi:hypothetical protein